MAPLMKAMAAQYVRFSRADLDKVKLQYDTLSEDPRVAGMSQKQMVRLATKMAMRPERFEEVDVPERKRRPRAQKKPVELTESKEEKSPLEDEAKLVFVGEGDAEGEGIVGDAVKKVGSLIKKGLAWLAPKDMSSAVKKVMTQYSDQPITGITVARVPIVGMIEKILRLVSRKAINYDTIYHLYMLIYLKNGVVLRVERNQTFQMEPASSKDINMAVSGEVPDKVKGPASIKVRVPSMALGQAMDNFIKEAKARNPTMGPWRYASMSTDGAESNNCQDMVLSWLKGMGVQSSEVQTFVKQQIDKLLPAVANDVQQGITDLAGAVKDKVFGKGRRRRMHTIDGEWDE